MKTDKMTAAIVVYNKKIEDSITYKNLQNISRKSVSILIIDNSDIETGNALYCKQNNLRYLSMNGNKGLSKAYNAAVEASLNDDVIVLLDDDTEITGAYFNVLETALYQHPEIDIFAPIIYGQDNVIYSPNEFHFLRNYFIQNPEQEVSQKLFNAIASCLAIRLSVFNGYRFNETLFVDQVDQYFFCEQRKRGKKFAKLDVSIMQNFYQRGAKLTPEAGWCRLQLRMVDIMRHAKLMGGLGYKLLGFIKCCGLGVQIAGKSGSIAIFVKAVVLSVTLLLKLPQ